MHLIIKAACLLGMLACFFLSAGYGKPVIVAVSIVKNGEARAIVVTAEKPTLTAAYAAQELVTHVEKATGKRLQVVTESKIPEGYESRIFIGATKAAREHGINLDTLGNDEFILRTIGSDLYILGKEDVFGSPPADRFTDDARIDKIGRSHPLSQVNQYSGTLYGAYEFLERFAGVCWLWPGDLGTYVPRAETIEIGALDAKIGPRVLSRDIGGPYNTRFLTGIYLGETNKPNPLGGYMSEEVLRNLVFPTEEAGHIYGKAFEIFKRRHRVGFSYFAPRVPRTGQRTANLSDWWGKYGKEHPEWFAMRDDGTRGPKKGEKTTQVAFCDSNPELHKFIVNEAWDGGNILHLGGADIAFESLCQCPNCLAWDGPQPNDFPECVREKYTPRVVSDRFAHYWKTIYELAVKRNPKVKITVLMYHNWSPAPLKGIKLNENIHGEFVIYGGVNGWYPMSAEEDQWLRKQWRGWEQTGIQMFYYSNHLLGNYVVPNITTWQMGEFFKFAHKHGMSGAYLAENGSFAWAAHGPMAYLHYRILWNPDLEIKDIRNDYFSAFGPAAGLVEQYFDYWEKHARMRPALSKAGIIERQYGALEKLRRPLGAYLAFPPEVYPPAEAILAKALEAARKNPNPEFAERVKFLQAGLKHAQLSTRICKFLDYDLSKSTRAVLPADPQKLKQAQQAMRELIQFRQAPENMFVADYIGAAKMEQGTLPLQLEPLFEDYYKRLAPSNSLPEPLADWKFRPDPEDRGVKEEWYKAAADDNQWKPIAVPAFWPKTEKGDFLLGYCWYRVAFTVPEKWRGRPMNFLFGAVDEQAWVYVNGQPAGESSIKSTKLTVDDLWDRPFTIEVKPDLIKFGEKNLLVVRVHNSAANGGIWKPVTGYLPEEKKDQPKKAEDKPVDQIF